jgi:hypothetical protein
MRRADMVLGGTRSVDDVLVTRRRDIERLARPQTAS